MTVTLPLRTTNECQDFVDAYFGAVGATTLVKHAAYREYELPRDVDKELTDRPYYWMWVERTAQEVKPTVLRLAFSDEAATRENSRLREKALAELEKRNPTDIERMYFRPPTTELIQLGSFRLDRIMTSLDTRGRFACVKAKSTAATWIPWLIVNAVISYRCDLIEQAFHSIGCCLANGQLVDQFTDKIARIEMEHSTPHELLKSTKLSIDQAFQRIRSHLEYTVSKRPLDWAATARDRFNHEIKQTRTYYASILHEAKPDELPLIEAEQRRKELALQERMQPCIEIQLRQVALVGLVER